MKCVPCKLIYKGMCRASTQVRTLLQAPALLQSRGEGPKSLGQPA